MSEYHSYYIGYQTKDNMIYPIGPFDSHGKLHAVFYRSRSFASDLYEIFYGVRTSYISDKLCTCIYRQYDVEPSKDNLKSSLRLDYLPLDDLPAGGFVKNGYFLIEDVQRYLSAKSYDRDELVRYELFFDRIPVSVYAAKLQNELLFGSTSKVDDNDDENVDAKSCKDYMYFSYPDLTCQEYEAFCIRLAANMFESYQLPKDARLVVIHDVG